MLHIPYKAKQNSINISFRKHSEVYMDYNCQTKFDFPIL